MKNAIASTPIFETITKALTFFCELSDRKDISLLSISCGSGVLNVSFILHHPETTEKLLGSRTFNENTCFLDADDLLDELWMTNDLAEVSVTYNYSTD